MLQYIFGDFQGISLISKDLKNYSSEQLELGAIKFFEIFQNPFDN